MSARVRSTLWTRCTRVTMIARFRQTTGRCESGPWTREVGCAREPYLHFCFRWRGWVYRLDRRAWRSNRRRPGQQVRRPGAGLCHGGGRERDRRSCSLLTRLTMRCLAPWLCSRHAQSSPSSPSRGAVSTPELLSAPEASTSGLASTSLRAPPLLPRAVSWSCPKVRRQPPGLGVCGCTT
jgi:hypothetical protein